MFWILIKPSNWTLWFIFYSLSLSCSNTPTPMPSSGSPAVMLLSVWMFPYGGKNNCTAHCVWPQNGQFAVTFSTPMHFYNNVTSKVFTLHGFKVCCRQTLLIVLWCVHCLVGISSYSRLDELMMKTYFLNNRNSSYQTCVAVFVFSVQP